MRQRSDDYLQRNPPLIVKTEPVLSVDFSQETPQGVTLFSGKQEEGAFHFTDTASRIRLPSLGKLSSFTVLINIRVDRISRINPILMSEGTKANRLIWTITSRGAMAFGSHRSGTNRTFGTPIVFTPEEFGEWMQLGLSYDARSHRMSVYLNGNIVSTARIPGNSSIDLSALDIGNWKQKTNVGQLDGAVRSIVVFDRVLEMSEIRKR